MPTKPLRECKVRGCRGLTRNGYCTTHADGKQQEAKYYNNMFEINNQQAFTNRKSGNRQDNLF